MRSSGGASVTAYGNGGESPLASLGAAANSFDPEAYQHPAVSYSSYDNTNLSGAAAEYDHQGVAVDAAEYAAYGGVTVQYGGDGGDSYYATTAATENGYGNCGDAVANGNGNGVRSEYAWPADPEGMLALLQQQRQQYRSWVAQCAVTTLAALDPAYGNASGGPTGTKSQPGEVPSMLSAMETAATVRQYLTSLKAASEAVRDATRAGAHFATLNLPASDQYDSPDDVAASEAGEAEYISAAYGVTTAVASAGAVVQQLQQAAGTPETEAALAEALAGGGGSGGGDGGEAAVGADNGPLGDLVAPLIRKLERVGEELCRRLRQEAESLMALIHWPPPLADMHTAGGTGMGPNLSPSLSMGVTKNGGQDSATPVAAAAAAEGLDADGAFVGFARQPLLARRLVGLLTALIHYQMAVGERQEFYTLLSSPASLAGQADSAEAEDENSLDTASAKPLLWAAKALADPVAAKLRAHFHPAAPTGLLDRPAWLYGTVLDFVRRHGHSLSALDDMLACLQLKPHYNMPAEFARALQEAVLQQLRAQRIPALLALPTNQPTNDLTPSSSYNQQPNLSVALENGKAAAPAAITAETGSSAAAAAADVEGLWLGLVDASAAYDTAMLPLLGATGARVEELAAKAGTWLQTKATGGASHRRRAADLFDPTAAGTADMHRRYVAVAALAAPEGSAAAVQPSYGASPPPTLAAWASAEAVCALRAVEALAYDMSSLTPAEEAARAALGGLSAFQDDLLSTPASAPGAPPTTNTGPTTALTTTGGPAPWQRHVWPPVLAREVAGVLDGLVARSRWLSAVPSAQRDFLEATAGPVLGLLRRRLERLIEQAVARGEVVSEEGLSKVCAVLCAAHAVHEHLLSLLLTELAPLVQALNSAAANAAANAGDAGSTSAAAADGGSSGPTTPRGKLSGGFWSGLLGGGGGGAAVPSSPARQALRDGVTLLAGGAAATGSTSAGPIAAGGAAAAVPSPGAGAQPPVLGQYVRAFARLHRDGCLKVSREVALGFGRHSVSYRHTIEASRQFPFAPEDEAEDGMAEDPGQGEAPPIRSITPAFAPALLFLQTTLERMSRCCDKVTFADVWRGAALSINRFMFNFIATESRFSRSGARQFAADVTGLAQLFAPYTRRGAGAGGAATSRLGSCTSIVPVHGTGTGGGGGGGAAHFRELQAAARLLCLGDEEAADVMRRASTAAVAAAQHAGSSNDNSSTPNGKIISQPGITTTATPAAACSPGGGAAAPTHLRGDPVRSGMATDPVLASLGLACLSPLQIMNVIEHRL